MIRLFLARLADAWFSFLDVFRHVLYMLARQAFVRRAVLLDRRSPFSLFDAEMPLDESRLEMYRVFPYFS